MVPVEQQVNLQRILHRHDIEARAVASGAFSFLCFADPTEANRAREALPLRPVPRLSAQRGGEEVSEGFGVLSEQECYGTSPWGPCEGKRTCWLVPCLLARHCRAPRRSRCHSHRGRGSASPGTRDRRSCSRCRRVAHQVHVVSSPSMNLTGLVEGHAGAAQRRRRIEAGGRPLGRYRDGHEAAARRGPARELAQIRPPSLNSTGGVQREASPTVGGDRDIPGASWHVADLPRIVGTQPWIWPFASSARP